MSKKGRGHTQAQHEGRLISSAASSDSLRCWTIRYDDGDEESGFFGCTFSTFYAYDKDDPSAPPLARAVEWLGAVPQWAEGACTPEHHTAAAATAEQQAVPKGVLKKLAHSRSRDTGRECAAGRSQQAASPLSSRQGRGSSRGRGRGRGGGLSPAFKLPPASKTAKGSRVQARRDSSSGGGGDGGGQQPEGKRQTTNQHESGEEEEEDDDAKDEEIKGEEESEEEEESEDEQESEEEGWSQEGVMSQDEQSHAKRRANKPGCPVQVAARAAAGTKQGQKQQPQQPHGSASKRALPEKAAPSMVPHGGDSGSSRSAGHAGADDDGGHRSKRQMTEADLASATRVMSQKIKALKEGRPRIQTVDAPVVPAKRTATPSAAGTVAAAASRSKPPPSPPQQQQHIDKHQQQHGEQHEQPRGLSDKRLPKSPAPAQAKPENASGAPGNGMEAVDGLQHVQGAVGSVHSEQQAQQQPQEQPQHQQSRQQQQQHPQQVTGVTRIGGFRRTSITVLNRADVDGHGGSSSLAAAAVPSPVGSGTSGGGDTSDTPVWNDEDADSSGDDGMTAGERREARSAAAAAAAADAAVDAVLAGLTGTGASIKASAARLLELCEADATGGGPRRPVARILARMER